MQNKSFQNISPDDWRIADGLLDRLLELPIAERMAQLQTLNLSDNVLRALTSLLDADSATSSPLDQMPELPIFLLEQNALVSKQFGRWILDQEIGRGGMAAVYRAHAVDQVEQLAAVKILARANADDESVRRFLGERSLQSRLNHPFITNFLEAGENADGTLWIAMNLVNGPRIDVWCREQKFGVHERVRLMLDVCAATSHAHAQLVIHRDIKPSNVLIDAGSGHPKLLDFGIAELETKQTEAKNASLNRFLTPQYAAPEQFLGASASTAMDIYGLGALLYQLLTGVPPQFCANNEVRKTIGELTDASKAITSNQYTFDLRKNADAFYRIKIQGELDSIVRKALARSPSQRYSSVESFRDDLQAYLQMRPVSTHKPSKNYLFSRLIARNKIAALSLALAVIALISGASISLWQAKAARQQARLAEVEKKNALQAKASADEQARRANELRDFAIGMFESSVPDRPANEIPSSDELLRIGESRALNALQLEPATRAEMLLTIGSIYLRRNLFDRTQTLADEGIRIAQEINDPLLLARAYTLRGKLYLNTDQPALARALYSKAHDLLAPQYQDSEMWYRLIFEMGWERFYSKENRAAVAILEPVILQARRSKTIRPADFAGLLNVVSLAYRDSDQFDLASAASIESLSIKQKLYGPQHLVTAVSLSNTGALESERGEFKRARELLTQAIASYDAISEKPMDYRGAARTNLALLSLRESRFDEALQLFKQVNIERATFNAIDPNVYPYGQRDLAQVYLAQNKYELALPILQKAEQYAIQYHRNGGPKMNIDVQLAQAYCRTSQVARAQEFLDRIDQIQFEKLSAASRSEHFFAQLDCAFEAKNDAKVVELSAKIRTLDKTLPAGHQAEVMRRAQRLAQIEQSMKKFTVKRN